MWYGPRSLARLLPCPCACLLSPSLTRVPLLPACRIWQVRGEVEAEHQGLISKLHAFATNAQQLDQVADVTRLKLSACHVISARSMQQTLTELTRLLRGEKALKASTKAAVLDHLSETTDAWKREAMLLCNEVQLPTMPLMAPPPAPAAAEPVEGITPRSVHESVPQTPRPAAAVDEDAAEAHIAAERRELIMKATASKVEMQGEIDTVRTHNLGRHGGAV